MSQLLTVLLPLVGTAIGALASLLGTVLANRSERRRQDEVYKNAVRIEDRRSLIGFFERIRDRYSQIATNHEELDTRFGDGKTIFSDGWAGMWSTSEPVDKELNDVLLEAEIIAPESYYSALHKWVQLIYGEFGKYPEDAGRYLSDFEKYPKGVPEPGKSLSMAEARDAALKELQRTLNVSYKG